jgi:hypothetical protein
MSTLTRTIPAVAAAGLLCAPFAFGQASPPAQDGGATHEQTASESDLLEPIPATIEEIPPLADMTGKPTAQELYVQSQARDYLRQIKLLKHQHFGNKKNEEIRAQGLEEIAEFTDPASFIPLIEELRDEQDDVRLTLLDHFATQGEWGQAALAWIAIHEQDDEAFHYEALKRLTTPVGNPALNVIDAGLRSTDDFTANLAGRLAGHLQIFDAIPLLIHGQAAGGEVQEAGDLAWILVGKQKVFIRALIPILGDNSGAFMPVPGVLTEGVVMRVVDAVAIIYRTEIHNTLLAMAERQSGRSMAHLGYDKEKWVAWYNDEYLPQKNQEILAQRLANEKHEKVRGQ